MPPARVLQTDSDSYISTPRNEELLVGMSLSASTCMGTLKGGPKLAAAATERSAHLQGTPARYLPRAELGYGPEGRDNCSSQDRILKRILQ